MGVLGGVLWDFSPLVTELCSDGKGSRTQQLDGSKEAAGETISEGKPLGHSHITSSVWFMLGSVGMAEHQISRVFLKGLWD